MKTLKQSWLTGQIGKSLVSMHTPINDLARPLFKNWTEKEMRNCWRDFRKILNKFIKRNSENAHSERNLAIFIVKDLFILEGLQAFMNKWNECFKKIVPPKIIHPRKPSKFITENTITIEYILGALFILDHAERNEFGAVLDMYSLLSDDQLHVIKNTMAQEEGVSKNCKEIALLPRTSTLNILILQLLNKYPNFEAKRLLRELQSWIGKTVFFQDICPQIVIKMIDADFISWVDKHGKTRKAVITGTAFDRRVSGLKDLR